MSSSQNGSMLSRSPRLVAGSSSPSVNSHGSSPRRGTPDHLLANGSSSGGTPLLAEKQIYEQQCTRIAMNPYDKQHNASGIIDIGSTNNRLMEAEICSALAMSMRAQRNETHLNAINIQHQLLTEISHLLKRHLKASATHQWQPASSAMVADRATAIRVVADELCGTDGVCLVTMPCDLKMELGIGQRQDGHNHNNSSNNQPLVPVYPRYTSTGRHFKFAVDERRIDDTAAAVKHLGRTKCLVVSDPNPVTGEFLAASEWRAVGSWCSANSVHIVVDVTGCVTRANNCHSASGGTTVDVPRRSESLFKLAGVPLAFFRDFVHIIYAPGADLCLPGPMTYVWSNSQSLVQHVRQTAATPLDGLSMRAMISGLTVARNTDFVQLSRRRLCESCTRAHSSLEGMNKWWARVLTGEQQQQQQQSAVLLYEHDVCGTGLLLDLSHFLGAASANISSSSKHTLRQREAALFEALVGVDSGGVYLEPGAWVGCPRPGVFRFGHAVPPELMLEGIKRLFCGLVKFSKAIGLVGDRIVSTPRSNSGRSGSFATDRSVSPAPSQQHSSTGSPMITPPGTLSGSAAALSGSSSTTLLSQTSALCKPWDNVAPPPPPIVGRPASPNGSSSAVSISSSHTTSPQLRHVIATSMPTIRRCHSLRSNLLRHSTDGTSDSEFDDEYNDDDDLDDLEEEEVEEEEEEELDCGSDVASLGTAQPPPIIKRRQRVGSPRVESENIKPSASPNAPVTRLVPAARLHLAERKVVNLEAVTRTTNTIQLK